MFAVEVVSSPVSALFPDTPVWRADMAALSEYDETLIKPMILFADRVSLLTDREDMIDMAVAQGHKLQGMPLQRFVQFMAFSARNDSEEIRDLGLSLSQIAPPQVAKDFLAHMPNRDELFNKVWPEYESRADEFGHAVFEVWRDRHAGLTSPNLQALERAGILEVHGWSSGPNREDLRANPSLNAEFLTRNLNMDENLSRIIYDMKERLESSNGVLMADPGAEFFLRRGDTKSPTPATLATSIIARLPGLQGVGIEELVQIRHSLEPYLGRFRGSMVSISAAIAEKGTMGPEARAQELDRLWYAEVEPARSEIAAELRRGGYPRALLTAFTDDTASKIAAGASVAIASGSFLAGATALIPAVIAGALPFAKALATRLDAQDAARANRMFFIYAAQEQLRKRRRRK